MNAEELEVMDVSSSNSLELINKSEIDAQIATAHKFPRSLSSFQSRAIDMVSLDKETAESCVYSRPVGGGKYAEGESVRLAEIVSATYGNIRIAARIVEQSERMVKCQGIAHDLESNTLVTSECIESTVKKNGEPYDERMRIVVAKACLSKARRDATFQVIPKALCKKLVEKAKEVINGGATLEERRTGAVKWIKSLKLSEDRVYASLGIEGAEDISEKVLVTLTGLRTAIKDKEITIEEAFPDKEKGSSMVDMAQGEEGK